MAAASKAGKGVVAMKVMAGGFRRAKPGDKIYNTLKKEGAMLAALKWVLNDTNVDTTIPSMTDMDQLDENLKAMSTELRRRRTRRCWREQLEYIAPLYCRMCGACDGTCPKGVPVPDVLRFLTYAEGYGAVRAGARALPRTAGGRGGRALQRVPHLHGELPQRREGGRAADPRAGTLRMRLISLTAAALAAAACGFGQPAPDCNLVPGWQQQGQPRTHNAENLFEYMNGNAEGYLIYGFKGMNGVTCKQGENVLVIDIFEMNDPDSAYGLFTANHDPNQPVEKFGMTAQVAPRRGSARQGQLLRGDRRQPRARSLRGGAGVSGGNREADCRAGPRCRTRSRGSPRRS